jgi:hypothetical protein
MIPVTLQICLSPGVHLNLWGIPGDVRAKALIRESRACQGPCPLGRLGRR